MLTIRSEQKRAFEEAQLARFQNDVLAHIRRADPEAAQARPEELEQVVRDAVALAAQFNFVTRKDAFRYVLFVYLFQSGFESNPSYPWCGEVDDPDITLRQKLDILSVFGEHLLGPRFRQVMPRSG